MNDNLPLDCNQFTVPYRYLLSFYWALQTISTVGYGDFGSHNYSEMIITILWMLIGVGYYSYMVGAVTSTITSQTSSIDDLEVS